MTIDSRLRRPLAIGAVIVAVLGGAWLLRHGLRPHASAASVTVEPVQRRDIALTIEATGTVEPINLIEVKSKASGQIVRMTVEAGTKVKAGDLLAQIDTRDVKNQYDQSLAALRAAETKLKVSSTQRRRADDLLAQQVITAPEHETATLDYASSQAAVVKARADLDIAKQRLDDATVRAPSDGTVLEQLVSNGQVISSATSSASGGTSLLKMADLGRIRVRALVNETDIGNVHPGQVAAVTVDAFPQRPFQGEVEKVEPQAVVQQSVTLFPVLITISNEAGLLLPGMNGEVSMTADRREGVLAVPLDAVRSVREVPAVATAIGLDPKQAQKDVQAQVDSLMAARRARVEAVAGDTTLAGRRWGAAGAGGDSAGGRPGMRGGGQGGSGRYGGAGGGGAGGDSAMRARWGGRGGSGRRGVGGSRGGGGGGDAAMAPGAFGPAAGGGMPAGAGGGGGGRGGRPQVVFVKTANGLEPRVVRLGLSDFDYAEVLGGLAEGDQVALLSVAEAQAKRTQTQSQIRQRMGTGIVPGGGGGGGGGGRGGGGGGGR